MPVAVPVAVDPTVLVGGALVGGALITGALITGALITGALIAAILVAAVLETGTLVAVGDLPPAAVAAVSWYASAPE